MNKKDIQKVLGIGGIFFVARDPEQLGKWYEKHLGVKMPPETYNDSPWHQEEGPTIFGFMSHDSEHFRGTNKVWSVNFRVKDLKAMITQLESAGIRVSRDPKQYPDGFFASLNDPEGNLIQLWEPK